MSNKRIKQLEDENQKLREALTNALMPLFLMTQYYGRRSLKAEMMDQAKTCLKQAKLALEYQAVDMAIITDTEEEEWKSVLEDLFDGEEE